MTKPTEQRLPNTLPAGVSPQQSLLDALPEIVFSVDEQGRFSFLNAAWQRQTGHLLQASVGEPLQSFMVDSDFASLQQQMADQPQIHGEFRFLASDQRLLWFELSARKDQSDLHGTLVNIDQRIHEHLAKQHREQRFRTVVESVAEILFQTDQELRLSFVNPAWCAVTGFSETESIGKLLTEFIWEEDRKHSLECWDCRNVNCTPCRQEFRLICKSGVCRWMSMRAKVGHDGSNVITGAMLDITERKAMEESLRRSEERYALLASSTTDGIWDWDLLTDKVYFSPRWKAMIGYQDDELENTFATWHKRVHPDDINAAMDAVMSCLEGHKAAYENIHRMQHRDGSWRWIFDRGIVLRDAQGLPYRMVGSHADVTVLKRTEETLQQRERELEAIVSISPDGIVTIAQQGVIQSVNPAFLSMTGFDLNLLLGLAEADFEQCLNAIADEQPRYRTRTQSAEQVYFVDLNKLCNHPLRARQDRDSKETKRHSPKLRVLSRTERQLHSHGIAKVIYFRDISTETEVDQMKSQFLSTAAHELRTPMASVLGFSELLLSRDFDLPTTREILNLIHQQSASLVTMLSQLLDLARIESRMGLDFCFVRQPLWPIVQRAIAELLVPGDTRTIVCRQPKGNPEVYVDADKLRQVISNVLVNAYKYSPQGGEISLQLKTRQHADGTGDIGIVIKDHGLGMSNEQLKHIYERFWRADNSGKISGTGLGMSLVKEIMDIHQGQIEIKSRPGSGTTVNLWLKQIQP